MIPRKLLILDLDETLMFATAHPPDNLWTHELANFKVYVRVIEKRNWRNETKRTC